MYKKFGDLISRLEFYAGIPLKTSPRFNIMLGKLTDAVGYIELNSQVYEEVKAILSDDGKIVENGQIFQEVYNVGRNSFTNFDLKSKLLEQYNIKLRLYMGTYGGIVNGLPNTGKMALFTVVLPDYGTTDPQTYKCYDIVDVMGASDLDFQNVYKLEANFKGVEKDLTYFAYYGQRRFGVAMLPEDSTIKIGDIVTEEDIDHFINNCWFSRQLLELGVDIMPDLRELLIETFPTYGEKIYDEIKKKYADNGEYCYPQDMLDWVKGHRAFLQSVRDFCRLYPKLEQAEKYFLNSKISGVLYENRNRRAASKNTNRTTTDLTNNSETRGNNAVENKNLFDALTASTENLERNVSTSGNTTEFVDTSGFSDSLTNGVTDNAENELVSRDRDKAINEILKDGFTAESPVGQFINAFSTLLCQGTPDELDRLERIW